MLVRVSTRIWSNSLHIAFYFWIVNYLDLRLYFHETEMRNDITSDTSFHTSSVCSDVRSWEVRNCSTSQNDRKQWSIAVSAHAIRLWQFNFEISQAFFRFVLFRWRVGENYLQISWKTNCRNEPSSTRINNEATLLCLISCFLTKNILY